MPTLIEHPTYSIDWIFSTWQQLDIQHWPTLIGYPTYTSIDWMDVLHTSIDWMNVLHTSIDWMNVLHTKALIGWMFYTNKHSLDRCYTHTSLIDYLKHSLIILLHCLHLNLYESISNDIYIKQITSYLDSMEKASCLSFGFSNIVSFIVMTVSAPITTRGSFYRKTMIRAIIMYIYE